MDLALALTDVFRNLECQLNFGERGVHKNVPFHQSTYVSFRKGRFQSSQVRWVVTEGTGRPYVMVFTVTEGTRGSQVT